MQARKGKAELYIKFPLGPTSMNMEIWEHNLNDEAV